MHMSTVTAVSGQGSLEEGGRVVGFVPRRSATLRHLSPRRQSRRCCLPHRRCAFAAPSQRVELGNDVLLHLWHLLSILLGAVRCTLCQLGLRLLNLLLRRLQRKPFLSLILAPLHAPLQCRACQGGGSSSGGGGRQTQQQWPRPAVSFWQKGGGCTQVPSACTRRHQAMPPGGGRGVLSSCLPAPAAGSPACWH